MKIGRNEPCPCGSGKKYKRCCLAKDEAAVAAAAVADQQEDHPFALPTAMLDEINQLSGPVRQEIGPWVDTLTGMAEYEARRPAIHAALVELQNHRQLLGQILQKPGDLFQRLATLIREPALKAMRFSVAEMTEVIDAFGPPPDPKSPRFYRQVEKMLDHMLSKEQRLGIAWRLLNRIADLVAQDRRQDALVIWHSADLIVEADEKIIPPFLLVLFMDGLQSWDEALRQENASLLDQVGLDAEWLLAKSYDDAETVIEETFKDKARLAKLASLLNAHPQLRQKNEALCRQAEKAALSLLKRDDFQSLLLGAAEVDPWLPAVEERISAACNIDGLQKAAQAKKSPSRKMIHDFFAPVYEVAGEMADQVLTEQRLEQLRRDIQAHRERLADREPEAMEGINGMLMAACATDKPSDSHFLNVLCTFSLVLRLKTMQMPPDLP